MTICRKCHAHTPPSDWGSHQRLFHTPPLRRFHCRGCEYSSDCLSTALSHCILEGHNLRLWLSFGTTVAPINSNPQDKSLSSTTGTENSKTNQKETVRSKEQAVARTRVTEEKKSNGNATGEFLTSTFVGESDATETENARKSRQGSKAKTKLKLPGNEQGMVIDNKETNKDDSPENGCSDTTIHENQGKDSFTAQSVSYFEEFNVSGLELEDSMIQSMDDTIKETLFADNDAELLDDGQLGIEPKQPKKSRKRKSKEVTDGFKPNNRLNCAKCGRSISYGTSKARSSDIPNKGHMNLHVRACYNLRPFSCSSCGFSGNEVGKIRKHIKARCPGAEMLRKDDSKALRKGMRNCFPQMLSREVDDNDD